ncbi:MAG: nitrate reductase molybdenum cofactor assembly chaperone [Burkholderiales bacterium]|nr:nitrate reductase molybdenum cofactor assembly chaperone [Burkholderiales bacterium]
MKPQPPGVIYSVFATLLDYPDQHLLDALEEARALLRDAPGLTRSARSGAERFIDYCGERDLLTLQENYVALFDRGRDTSLYLFEHVHGESRDRGQAMVDLLQMYEQHGLRLERAELPDYLPVFLEYLSLLPADEARSLLRETGEILQAIATQLAKRASHYSFIVGALLPLAGVGDGPTPVVANDDDALAPPDPAELRSLDAAYADAPVRFTGAPAPATEPITFYNHRPAR